MFRTIKIALFAIALCGVSTVAIADVSYGDPASWDLLDQNYGSNTGAGQVSFNAGMVAQWGTSLPTEVLSDGKATLTVAADGHSYPCIQDIAGFGTGGADVTLEFKAAAPAKDRLQLFLQQAAAGSLWNHAIEINGQTFTDGTGTIAIHVPDAMVDYYTKTNDLNQAPAGFDGSQAHTYRIVRDTAAATTSLYLDNNPTALLTFLAGGGGEAQTIEWGLFSEVTGMASTYDMYYMKAASGAWTPQPTPEPSSIMLLAIGVISLLAYAWRKRK